MYRFIFALFYLQLVHDATGDVIITIKSDAEDAFQFRVTGHHSKKNGQVVNQQMMKKKNNTDTRQNNIYDNRVKILSST